MLRTILMASGLVFVLALSACGDGGDPGTAVPPADTAPPAGTPPAQQ